MVIELVATKLSLRLNLNEMVQLRILNAVVDAFKPSISHG
jgi:hypothetical protein